MPGIARIAHEFVETVPDNLEEGIIYISMPFATAIHKCCCGCGAEIVTPFSPAGWKLIFDGKTVSLYPSIGNWSFACQSHYWIKQSRIVWAAKWSKEQIKAGRLADQTALDSYFETPGVTPSNEPTGEHGAKPTKARKKNLWEKLIQWFQ